MIKFVNDLRQVVGFLSVLRFPPLIKLTATLLKVALNTITLSLTPYNTSSIKNYIHQNDFFFFTADQLKAVDNLITEMDLSQSAE